MGGKGSGGRRSNSDKLHELTPQSQYARNEGVEHDRNHKNLEFTKAVMLLEPIEDWTLDAVSERFDEYVRLCDTWDVRPMVQSCALAFDMDRHNLYDIANGRQRSWKNATPESIRFLQKIYNFLHANAETNLTNENGNPVKWFFLMKNHFSYQDQTEKIVRRIDEKPVLADPAAIAAKYAAMTGQEPKQLSVVEAEVIDIQPSEPDDSEN